MERKNLLFLIFFSMLFLVGCNNDQVTEVPDNAPVENDDGKMDMSGKRDENQTKDPTQKTENQVNTNTEQELFPFTSFDLDVKYDGNREFDVDYENDREGMEAELKDEINNEHLRGDEAFERIRPIFESFTFTKDTPMEEVISEVLQAFNLEDNYIEFDLDIDFSDGTERDYEDGNG